jgi:Protein of unknown function (DUF3352)
MRRFAALLALVALLLVAAGCSGHDDQNSTALDDALGYFAKDAPFVAAIETDPDGSQVKQVKQLIGRFPGAEILATRVQNAARVDYVQWERDIKPQLGAPLVVGLAKPAAGRAALAAATVVAMRVQHPLRVKQLLLRQPGFSGAAKSSGVRIYENPQEQRYAAVDGDVMVAATDRDILEQALAIKRSDNRMRDNGFNRDLAKLPSDGLVRVSADPRAMIGADPRWRPALSVKWLSSLRRLGAVLKASDSGLTLDFRAVTDGASITNDDLPLAPSSGSPPLIGTGGELQFGIREPSRLARFAFAVAHAVAPRHMAELKALEPKGIDLERQIPHHLGKTGALALDPLARTFAFRGDLNQSGDVKTALAQLTPALPRLAAAFGIKGVGIAMPEAGESFYALAKPNAKTVVFAVVGNSLVVASVAGRAAGLASEPTHAAPGGAKGAAVLTLNARDVVGKLLAKQLKGPAGLFAPLAVASLRDLTGFVAISRSGLRGHFKLTIVK